MSKLVQAGAVRVGVDGLEGAGQVNGVNGIDAAEEASRGGDP